MGREKQGRSFGVNDLGQHADPAALNMELKNRRELREGESGT